MGCNAWFLEHSAVKECFGLIYDHAKLPINLTLVTALNSDNIGYVNGGACFLRLLLF